MDVVDPDYVEGVTKGSDIAMSSEIRVGTGTDWGDISENSSSRMEDELKLKQWESLLETTPERTLDKLALEYLVGEGMQAEAEALSREAGLSLGPQISLSVRARVRGLILKGQAEQAIQFLDTTDDSFLATHPDIRADLILMAFKETLCASSDVMDVVAHARRGLPGLMRMRAGALQEIEQAMALIIFHGGAGGGGGGGGGGGRLPLSVDEIKVIRDEVAFRVNVALCRNDPMIADSTIPPAIRNGHGAATGGRLVRGRLVSLLTEIERLQDVARQGDPSSHDSGQQGGLREVPILTF